MPDRFGDARHEELKILTEIDRQVRYLLPPVTGHMKDLCAFLVQEKYVNDLTLDPQRVAEEGLSRLEQMNQHESTTVLFRILSGEETTLQLSHKGRVRISELKQALRTGREREPFGILWDVRHWELDVQIAILESAVDTPLALAYLDMNGLKHINDSHGHDAGDMALRTYFQAVATILGDKGQAYRLGSGADEVLVMFPQCKSDEAAKLLQLACKKLMAERLWPMDPTGLLSISIGIISSDDASQTPAALRTAAEKEQKRAKDRSREGDPRPSVIVINGHGNPVILEHDRFVFPIAIKGSMFRDVDGNMGVSLMISNNHNEPIPPFRVCIQNPTGSIFQIFHTLGVGVLLQNQQREFKCILIRGGKLDPFLHLVASENGKDGPIGIANAGFELQLILENSDRKILYQNKRLARALVRILRQGLDSVEKFGTHGSDWFELNNALPDS